MENALKRIRQQRGLDQAELARLAGVSRQTISSIELGNSDPSTALSLALARLLECAVEDLFWLEPGQEALSVEVARPLSAGAVPSARAAVASVGGRWIAHALPADAMGQPADALLPRSGRKVRPLRPVPSLRETTLAVGCDPALALLAAHAGEGRGARMVWLQASSTAALEALGRGEAHLAGAHLLDEESGEFNLPFVRALLPGRDVLVVNLARWRQGIVVRRGNPLRIRGAADLGARGVRIVNREAGSGARQLLDRHLAKHGIRSVRGADVVLGSHAAVAQAVAAGAADAGIATESAALALGLGFVALAEERSDLIVPRELAREARGERILETLASRAFRRDLGAIVAYETTHSGEVVAEVRA